jgi:glycyl-tRNA synthetase beta chain
VAELLLELLSDEIPAGLQVRAAEDLRRLVCDGLAAEGLANEGARCFAGPRRLALVVDGLPARQADQRQEKKGPRVGAPDAAVQGFLKSAGLTSLEQCERRTVDKGEFWFAVALRKGRATAEVLQAVLPAAIGAVPWPKSMRWGAHATRWIRPLQSILCVFAGQTVPIKFGHLVAGNRSRGHRFMAPKDITVGGAADYLRKLRQAKVIVDHAERRAAIWRQAGETAKGLKLTVPADERLLDEVTGLVEWPVALAGAIDDKFMGVPAEVLVSVMRGQQRYFALRQPADKRGADKLAARFLVIANVEAEDGGKEIVAGNERVLRARLSDAAFFWEQDRRATLESRAPALAGIVFHAKLGTVANKVERLRKLVVEIVTQSPGADAVLARRAALLAKADLTSGMVGEFPELQGVMGRYYALNDGERPEIAAAIAEHYAPLGPNDSCPTQPTSVVLSLADKLDSLVGFFAVDEKPTGSKDPFALRRAALGVIRLILENKLRLALRPILHQAYQQYLADFAEQRRVYIKVNEEFHAVPFALLRERGGESPPLFLLPLPAAGGGKAAAKAEEIVALPSRAALSAGLLEFFADRLKAHLREKGVRHDLVSAVFSGGADDDLVRLLQRVDALKEFIDSEDGANLLAAYRRAANIVRIESKKDGRTYTAGPPDPALLREPEETRLFERLNEVTGQAEAALGHEEFHPACRALARLRRPVDDFFEKVTVNVDDAALRANRLTLLARVQGALNRIADFSRIEG